MKSPARVIGVLLLTQLDSSHAATVKRNRRMQLPADQEDGTGESDMGTRWANRRLFRAFVVFAVLLSWISSMRI